MPYQKVITIFSKQERENLHRRGYWVDRYGNRIPVWSMDYERLDKLVKMLAGWAMDEQDPILYIKNMAIFPYVYSQIQSLKMNTYQSSMFNLASMLDFNDW